MLKIVLKKGYAGIPEKQKKVLRSLGLKKIGGSVKRADEKSVRGMINKIPHMVSVEIVEE